MEIALAQRNDSGFGGVPPAPASSDSAGAGKKPSALRVLVVDDEPLIRWSLRKGLTRSGHEVTEAGTAAEALELIGAGPGSFDAVILDYRLPDRRDLSLLKEVRASLPASRVVMMTAYGEDDMRTQALALGALAVVDKPFQVQALVALIETSRAH